MDTEMKSMEAPEKPKIPKILIEATIDAIQAGMKPDELAKAVEKAQVAQKSSTQVRSGSKKRRGVTSGKSRIREIKRARAARMDQGGADAEEEEAPRTYRHLDERRMGFLVVGDQHRFSGKQGKDRFIYPISPPLDYSFCMISRIEEIVLEGEEPHKLRQFTIPEKTPDERYQTSSVCLSYNVIESLEGLVNVLYKVLDGGPFGLCWVDVSFNAIGKIDVDTVEQLPNLKIMYLHGNAISDMTEIKKLGMLPNLVTLTLHGNPIEEEEGYRTSVLFYMPRLKHLDFIGVTQRDTERSTRFGPFYEPIWKKKHGELEHKYMSNKKAMASTYTERVMKGTESDSDDDNDDSKTFF